METKIKRSIKRISINFIYEHTFRTNVFINEKREHRCFTSFNRNDKRSQNFLIRPKTFKIFSLITYTNKITAAFLPIIHKEKKTQEKFLCCIIFKGSKMILLNKHHVLQFLKVKTSRLLEIDLL